MRKLIVSEFLTLDGVMQGPGHPDEDREGGFEHGGWQMPYANFDETQMQIISDGIARTGAYLFGRKTYQIFAAYWPHQPDTDMFARTLNGLPKYVVSTTLREPLEWQNSVLIRDEVVDAVRKLKQQDGGDISVLGSGELVQTLIEHDLVDELSLMVNPLVLGSGKRLFRDGLTPKHFRLKSAVTTSKGVLLLGYEPAEAPVAEPLAEEPAASAAR